MTLARVALAIGAVICAASAMGCWLLLQLGGVRPAESREIVRVMYSAGAIFIVLTGTSAYIRERKSGPRAVFVKMLYLVAAYALPSLALFTAVSRGTILQMPEVVGLSILFFCFLAFLRPQFQHPSEPKRSVDCP
jgi:hypothetical protein